MPVAQQRKPPLKRHSLPDGAIVLLIVIFCVCVGAAYVIRDQFGADWAKGSLGLSPLTWLVSAFFVVKPHWKSLTKKASDDLYIMLLLGFVGQLGAIVFYMWAA